MLLERRREEEKKWIHKQDLPDHLNTIGNGCVQAGNESVENNYDKTLETLCSITEVPSHPAVEETNTILLHSEAGRVERWHRTNSGPCRGSGAWRSAAFVYEILNTNPLGNTAQGNMTETSNTRVIFLCFVCSWTRFEKTVQLTPESTNIRSVRGWVAICT